MLDKHPIHTTLSTDAMRILERYEKEMGCKNVVLERALMGMDKLRYKEKIDTHSISRIIKRVNTGVPGFDSLVEGGIPEASVIILTGPPGTGKTTFSLQFLMEGLRNNEKCVFFSFEEMSDQIIKQTLRFGWDFGEYADKGYLEIFGFSRFSSEEIVEIIDIFKPKRIVFDTLSIFSDISEFRRSAQWRNILKVLKEKKITCMAVTEKNTRAKEFDDLDFMGDGVFYFDKKQRNEFEPYPTHFIHLLKMRLTKLNEIPQTFIFSDHGIQLVGARKSTRSVTNPLLVETVEKPASLENMGYELRLSLNSIIGFSELMIQKRPGELNQKQERYLHNVIFSGKNLLEFIQKYS